MKGESDVKFTVGTNLKEFVKFFVVFSLSIRSARENCFERFGVCEFRGADMEVRQAIDHQQATDDLFLTEGVRDGV